MNIKKHWLEEIFEKKGALRRGHFRLTSGRHTGEYLDKMMIHPDGKLISDICFNMANEIRMVFPGELPNKKNRSGGRASLRRYYFSSRSGKEFI